MSGTLYVIATPLGNLSDLSERAVRTLQAVDLVAAEDTRRARKLLSHLGTTASLVSLHAHAPDSHIATVVAALAGGRDVGFVTDAGTPGVSDPGVTLVRAARSAGAAIVPIPGPSAVVTALSAAGLPADRYQFLGFLPRKGPDRQRLLRVAAETPWTTVIYESPARLAGLLIELTAVLGDDREVVVARELTKLHEEIRVGSASELASHYGESGVKGEVTVLIAPGVPAITREPEEAVAAEGARLLREGLSRKDVIRRLTESTGWPRNDVYRLVTRLTD